MGKNGLGREDSNLRMQVPKTCVLPLDDAPSDRRHAAKLNAPSQLPLRQRYPVPPAPPLRHRLANPHLPAATPDPARHVPRDLAGTAQRVHGRSASRHAYTAHARLGQGSPDGAEHGKTGRHYGLEIVEARPAQTLNVTRFKMAKKNSSRARVVCQRRTQLAIGPGCGYVHGRLDEHERQRRRAGHRFELVAASACKGGGVRQQEKRYVGRRWRRRGGPIQPCRYADSRASRDRAGRPLRHCFRPRALRRRERICAGRFGRRAPAPAAAGTPRRGRPGCGNRPARPGGRTGRRCRRRSHP